MELEELLRRVRGARSWAQRVAAVRSVPAEFPGKEHQRVYAELGRSYYVQNLAPHFHIVPWPVRYLDRSGFLDAYRTAHDVTVGFTKTDGVTITRAVEANPRSLRIFRLRIGYTPSELAEALKQFGGARLGEAAINRLED